MGRIWQGIRRGGNGSLGCCWRDEGGEAFYDRIPSDLMKFIISLIPLIITSTVSHLASYVAHKRLSYFFGPLSTRRATRAAFLISDVGMEY